MEGFNRRSREDGEDRLRAEEGALLFLISLASIGTDVGREGRYMQPGYGPPQQQMQYGPPQGGQQYGPPQGGYHQ